MPVWSGGVDVLALDHAGGDALDRPGLVGRDRTLAVDRLAEGVDHAADQRVADRHRGDPAGGADLVALFDLGVLTDDEDADGVLFQVEGQADGVRSWELDQLTGHDLAQAVDVGDAVADADDRADVGDGDVSVA